MPETYTKAEVEDLFGKDEQGNFILPKSTIQLYTDREVVEPAFVPKRRGLARKYDPTNLVELLLCRKLVGIGFTIKQVGHILAIIRAGRPGLLDPGCYKGVSKNLAMPLIIEHSLDGKVSFDMPIKAGSKKDEVTIQMKNTDYVRIINILEIINTVIKET